MLGRWFARQYMKWLYFPQFDHHIAVSEYTAEELGIASRGHKVQRGVWLGPMGVDRRSESLAVSPGYQQWITTRRSAAEVNDGISPGTCQVRPRYRK
jgi:hypothetical protein